MNPPLVTLNLRTNGFYLLDYITHFWLCNVFQQKSGPHVVFYLVKKKAMRVCD